ncbi:MAG: hypothetical protein V3U92_15205 [Cellulophaga sp.]
MKKKILSLFVIVNMLFFYSCKESKDDKTASTSYKLFNLEQVGWKSKKVSHNFSAINYTAITVPIQYYILKNEGAIQGSKIDSIYESHKNERIIEMEFQHNKEDDLLQGEYTKMDYESAVKYMAFGIEKDFSVIVSSGDTIPCAGITFERNFKLAPFKRLLLHFGNIGPEENIQLVYNDKLFGNGILKFRFKEIPIKL